MCGPGRALGALHEHSSEENLCSTSSLAGGKLEREEKGGDRLETLGAKRRDQPKTVVEPLSHS